MLRRLTFVALVTLLLGVPSWADTGIFQHVDSIGEDGFIGIVQEVDYVGDPLTERYLFTGGGNDIWGNADAFVYGYRDVTGDVRISAQFSWVEDGDNDWAKMGVMIRETNAANSVQYNTVMRGVNDFIGMQFREGTGWGSGGQNDRWAPAPDGTKLGIAKVAMGPLTVLESTYDVGDGWEVLGQRIVLGLPDDMLAGVAVTSHDADYLVQAYVSDVKYEDDFELLGGMPEILTIPADAAQECPPEPGFQIRTLKATFTDGWGRAEMHNLLDYGCTGPFCTGPGMPIPGVEEGVRVSPVVNLHDSSGRVDFGDDETFPGIDPYQSPTDDPAAGDDDNNFATEVLACVELSEGLHVFGVNDDDGTIIEIGGVEIGRSGEWKGVSDTLFIFEVEAAGAYSFKARHLEGGGGAALELFEVLDDGTKVLLGMGPTAVYVPEPATIALLGLGGLALVRVRKRS
jgi:hypothetical protein